MIVDLKKSFAKDLKKINNKKICQQVKESIEKVENATSLLDVKSVKQLRASNNYYRISIGDYRVGLKREGEIILFVRCLHRKDIYRYFP